jgi:hypothetical protein
LNGILLYVIPFIYCGHIDEVQASIDYYHRKAFISSARYCNSTRRSIKLDPKPFEKISEEESTKHRKCPICGKVFDSIAEAQKHMTLEHMQKGETNTH